MIFSNSFSKIKIVTATFAFVTATTFLPFLFRSNKVSTDMDALLPNDPWIASHLDFLRNSQIGTMAAISLEANNGANPANLSLFAEKFANLARRDPMVVEVFFKIPPEKATAAAAFLCARAPQIITPEELKTLRSEITPNKIDDLMRSHYKEMLRPGALFRQKLIASDPFNLHEFILKKLRSIGGNSGFKFQLRENGLWSNDNRHFLILIRTNVPISDAGRGANFVATLKRCLDESRPSSDYDYIIMAGHRHAIDNRRLIERDITVTMCVAALGFIIMFAFLFRNWRAIFVFIVPFFGMGSAVGLTWLFFDAPSAIILGMGATVIGIALDYGIHVFVAVGGADPKNAKYHIKRQKVKKEPAPLNSRTVNSNKKYIADALAEVTRPIIFSALTTLGVFWAFFLSKSPGYHQLAFASTCGVAISVWVSLTCLPLLFKVERKRSQRSNPIILKFAELFRALSYGKTVNSDDNASKIVEKTPSIVINVRFGIILLWLVMLALSAVCAFKVEFQSNIRALDGVGGKLIDDEKAFRAIWGESSQAAVTIKSSTLEDAQIKQDELTKRALNAKIPGFQSLSMIWPSLSTRRKNAAAWDAFWSNKRIEKLKRYFREKGAKYLFSEKAFTPFFNKLRVHDFSANFADSPGFDLFRGKFAKMAKNKTRLDAYFDDTPNALTNMRKLTADIPDALVISPKRFGVYISNSILNDARRVAMFALPLIFLLAWICLRKTQDVALAMIPVVTAIAMEFPAHMLFGLKLNAIGLVAMIVVTGLAVDYGIFAVSAVNKKNARFVGNAVTSLTMSMLTTAIGSGALLFASHPALQTVGLVVTVGVVVAWISAIFAVPALSNPRSSLTKECNNT
jgi:predicted RND superfamily exporter protein